MAAAGLLSAMTVLFLAIPKKFSLRLKPGFGILVPKTRISIWDQYIRDKPFLLKPKLENVTKFSINVTKF